MLYRNDYINIPIESSTQSIRGFYIISQKLDSVVMNFS